MANFNVTLGSSFVSGTAASDTFNISTLFGSVVKAPLRNFDLGYDRSELNLVIP